MTINSRRNLVKLIIWKKPDYNAHKLVDNNTIYNQQTLTLSVMLSVRGQFLFCSGCYVIKKKKKEEEDRNDIDDKHSKLETPTA